MGLLESLGLGGQDADGQSNAGAGSLVTIIGALIAQSGGIQGLLDKLKSAGLGDAVSSWVGTGENQAADPAQLQAALGSSGLGDIASKLGIDTESASASLAEKLPGLIDQLSPNGEVDSGIDLAALLPSLLGGGKA